MLTYLHLLHPHHHHHRLIPLHHLHHLHRHPPLKDLLNALLNAKIITVAVVVEQS